SNDIGMPGATLGDPNTSGLVCISFTNYNNSDCLVGYSASLPWVRGETNINFVNNWTKTRSNHTFKWGVDVRRVRDDLAQWQSQNPRGVFRFNNSVTAHINSPLEGVVAPRLGPVIDEVDV